MAQVYVIRNKINGKEYVGKTNFSYEKRWKEHCRDRYTDRCKERPLYSAMNKYGIDNFEIELLHDNLTHTEAEKLEISEIERRDTFCSGYNLTVGGDGSTYQLTDKESIEKIKQLYSEKKTLVEISKIMECSPETVSARLKESGVKVETRRDAIGKNSLEVTKNGVTTFYELGSDFIDFLIDNKITTTTNRRTISTNIGRAINGTRKTYLGYTIRKV